MGLWPGGPTLVRIGNIVVPTGSLLGVVMVADKTSYSDTEFSDNIFERVGISVYNALRLDPEASVRGLLAPDTLPPGKRTTLAKQFTKGRKGLESFILAEVTNPLVLVGAAMSFRWPVLDPSKLRSAANTLKQYERYIPAPLRKLLGLNEVFVGTPIPEIASRISVDSDNFIHDFFFPVGEGIMAWRKAMRRSETIADQVRWATLADGTFSSSNLKAINRIVGRLNKGRSAKTRIEKLSAADARISSIAADDLVLTPYRNGTKGIQKLLSSDPKALASMVKFQRQSHGVSPEVEWVKDFFFPRIATRNSRAVRKIRERLIEKLLNNSELSKGSMVEQIKRFGKATADVKTSRLLARRNLLTPEVSDLSLLPKGSVSEKALRSLGQIQEEMFLQGKPQSYSLRFSPTVSSYAYSTGRAYAWSFLKHGERLISESRKVEAAERSLGLGLSKTELLRNVFIPGMMGAPTFDQLMKATEYAGIRQAAWKMIDDPNVMRGIPEIARKGLRTLLSEQSIWSPGSAGQRISNYFYITTLGANLGSSSQNLTQSLLTTAPLIGVSATLRGIAKTISKIPEFFRLRKSGLSEREVLTKLFPDFVNSGAELGTLTSELGLKDSADLVRGGLFGVRNLAGKARDILLAPFKATELFNRLSTFEGALGQAKEFGLTGRAASDHALATVNLTQLWAGGASQPAFLQNWWQPFAQFLTFPSKLLASAGAGVTPTFTGQGLEFGIGGGFNPGTLGRAVALSATAYTAAKEFADADISRSLLFGGLPLPQEQAVLSPLPFLPPFVSLSAGAIQDLVTGTTENTRRSAALLVPGGIQMARLSQILVPEVAKFMGRGYADTSKTRADGSVPMFDKNGNLTGYKDTFDLFLSGIGIPGKLLSPNGETKTKEVERYLLKQRDTIREMRSQFVNAYLDGDPVSAEKISEKHMADYGHGIQVRQQDWDAASMSRFVPRMERIAKTLPAQTRSRFLFLAHTALSGSGEQFLGVDPQVFSQPRRRVAELLRPPREQEELVPSFGP